jgi:hypothetical protein
MADDIAVHLTRIRAGLAPSGTYADRYIGRESFDILTDRMAALEQANSEMFVDAELKRVELTKRVKQAEAREAAAREVADAALRKARIRYEAFTPTTTSGEVNQWIHDIDVARATLAAGSEK